MHRSHEEKSSHTRGGDHPSSGSRGVGGTHELEVELPVSEASAPDAAAVVSNPPAVGNYLLQINRRVHFLRAAIVGVVAGGVAVLFQLCLVGAEGLRGTLADTLQPYGVWGLLITVLIAALLAGGAGWLTERYAPEASGSGIPHVRGVLAGIRSLNWRRLLPVKFAAGVLALGAGLSMGREGPTVQMGASVGKAFSQLLGVDKRSERNLIAAAAGAGLGAAFNAPLAGFIFVIEELQRELSPLTFVTALISSVTAVAVSRIFTGQFPSFHIRNYPLPPLTALPLFALMGVVAGYAGVIFNRTIIFGVVRAKKLGWPMWRKAAIAGGITAIVGWWLPEALGGGHSFAEGLLRGEYVAPGFVLFLIAVLVVKFSLTMTAYASGVPGGIFAPLLVLGAIIGQLFGHISNVLFPSVGTTPAAYAVVCMAAMFTSIVRAPLTGIVLILEMTGNQEQLFALILCCLIAYLVAEHARSEPVYDALMELDTNRDEPGEGHEDEPHLMLVVVQSHSRMDGVSIGDLQLPEGCILISVRRGTHEMIANRAVVLAAGDHVLAVLPPRKREELRALSLAT